MRTKTETPDEFFDSLFASPENENETAGENETTDEESIEQKIVIPPAGKTQPLDGNDSNCAGVIPARTNTTESAKIMANKRKFRRDCEIRIAAWLFMNESRDAEKIGEKLKMSGRNIRRLADTCLWNAVLDEWKYEGHRHFRVRKAGRKRKQ